MMRAATLLAALSAFAAAPVQSLHAQNLRTAVTDLFRFGTCPQPLCLPVSAAEHGAHFVPSITQGGANLVGFLTEAIGLAVTSIPISATTSGATFTFQNGVPVKSAISAGPLFAERAQTLGRRRLLTGANINSMSFTSLRGAPLTGLQFQFAHQDVAPTNNLGAPIFENDVIAVTTDLAVNLQVINAFATYGLTDRIDIGIAVPIVRTSIDGTSSAQIFAFGAETPHLFEANGARTPQARSASKASSASIGDIALRAKMNLGTHNGIGFGFLADARLPTGDTLSFAGSGGTTLRAAAIASARYGDFSPHVNAGYAYRGAELQNDALLATIGFDQLVAPWATFAFDVISEIQVGENNLTLPGTVQYNTPFRRTVQPTTIPERRDSRVDASAGFKFLHRSGTTGIVNALIPMNRGGLRPNVLWTAGLEYAF